MVSYQKKTNNIWAFIDNIDSNNADSMTYQRLLTPLPYKENGNKDKSKKQNEISESNTGQLLQNLVIIGQILV